MTTCVVIRNPAARHRLEQSTLLESVAVLRAAGWDVETAETQHSAHATEIARQASARGIDVVVANGGDGTINEVINGLAGATTVLGVLPAGTANVWAGEMRLPRQPVDAARTLVEGDRRRVDLGLANGRYFLLMAGIGLDARIIPHVDPTWKQRIGAAAYLLTGARAIFRTKGTRGRVTIGQESRDTSLYWMLISNTRSYGGITDIMFRAVVDDGLFDVGIMHEGGAGRVMLDGVRVLLKKHASSSNIDYVTARTVEIETPGIPVQLDGEMFGETPMRFEVAPLALRVIVPRGMQSPLFGRRAD